MPTTTVKLHSAIRSVRIGDHSSTGLTEHPPYSIQRGRFPLRPAFLLLTNPDRTAPGDLAIILKHSHVVPAQPRTPLLIVRPAELRAWPVRLGGIHVHEILDDV